MIRRIDRFKKNIGIIGHNNRVTRSLKNNKVGQIRFQNSFDKNHEQHNLKKLTKDNLIRQILIEYLLNGQNENE